MLYAQVTQYKKTFTSSEQIQSRQQSTIIYNSVEKEGLVFTNQTLAQPEQFSYKKIKCLMKGTN